MGELDISWWAWLGVSVVGAFLAVFDTCLSYRWLDGLHEGNELLVVQAALDGAAPGLDVRHFYGPLFDAGLVAWVRTFGATVFAERWYFQTSQWLGVVLALAAIRLVSRRVFVLGVGAWVSVMLSTAAGVDYGSSNLLRPALSAFALACTISVVPTLSQSLIMLSGAICSVSILYSPEYGLIASVGSVMVLLGEYSHRRTRGWAKLLCLWVASIGGTTGCLLLLLFGSRAGEFLSRVGLWGYASNHLSGHLVLPLDALPWELNLRFVSRHLSSAFRVVAIWLPGLTASLVLGVAVVTMKSRTRRDVVAEMAAAILALGACLPFVARPLDQVYGSMPLIALMLAVVLDRWHSWYALLALRRTVATLWCILGLAGAWLLAPMWTSKYSCVNQILVGNSRIMPRLGRIHEGLSRADVDLPLVDYLKTHVKRGKPVFVAAPRYAHLLFLSGTTALLPFPTTSGIACQRDEEAALRSIERSRPPVILLTDQGTDIPLALEHPQLWAYIGKHYRSILTKGELQILVPRGFPK